MKTQIKLFSSTLIQSLERDINKFINDKKVIDIQCIRKSSTYNCGPIIMVVYRDKEENSDEYI